MGKGEVPDREEINMGTFLKSVGIRNRSDVALLPVTCNQQDTQAKHVV